MKKIVVVGGGFAGIKFIKELWNDGRFEITLVDTNNYNFFPPLLYQVAAAFIEPSNISYPFRRMFQGKRIRFHLGALTKIDPENKRIETSTGALKYDQLVIALGTESNFFGLQSVKEMALPMKTISDALNLRNHLLQSMEKAELIESADEREKHLNIVIAGGGPSGVEIAGMLAEMAVHVIAREYPELPNLKAYIYLVDHSPELLGPMSKTAHKEAQAVLTRLGVKIKLGVAVKGYSHGQVLLSNGEAIYTSTLIWTAGVIGRELPGIPEQAVGKGRRVLVNAINQVEGLENIFAIGDIALQKSDTAYPDGHPQVAQVAIQQGRHLARNLKQLLSNKPARPFNYHDKGSMAIISKYKAVADLPAFSMKGFFAWLIWLFIHIFPIAGNRNKVKLAFNWFWAFISNNPTLRLIIRPEKKISMPG
jgi:NADH dehydrogenase